VAISYRFCIVIKSLSPAVFEIMGTKHIGVTILTFQGHVTSSVTWPFDSHMPNSYRCSIVTKSLFPAIFEIMGTKHIGVTILTFQGHVTSSVKWAFDSQVAISNRWSIKPSSPAIFETLAPSTVGSWLWPFMFTWLHRSREHLIPIWPFPISAPLSSSLCLQPCSR